MKLNANAVRYLGGDAGRQVILVLEPGGALGALADRVELESAVQLSGRARRLLAGEPTADELAALVPSLVTTLDRVIAVAGQDMG
ncbi:hypothetical protein [Streptomyces sp. CO7]